MKFNSVKLVKAAIAAILLCAFAATLTACEEPGGSSIDDNYNNQADVYGPPVGVADSESSIDDIECVYGPPVDSVSDTETTTDSEVTTTAGTETSIEDMQCVYGPPVGLKDRTTTTTSETTTTEATATSKSLIDDLGKVQLKYGILP